MIFYVEFFLFCSTCFLSCVLLLQTVKGMLDNPNEPVSDLSYFDCIESVMENSKVSLPMLLTFSWVWGKV